MAEEVVSGHVKDMVCRFDGLVIEEEVRLFNLFRVFNFFFFLNS
ncbi:hypothetical protein TorRG33x02_310220 [Trema orientale]|uniref:Uncharacterized protein n=1 Tax=Trema orientale TaxID=63057 RepID=A0A2P5BSR8_TREOI|nr:hypothetical protein TorRG33x02_310220 [Trema orientale]